MTRPKKNRVLIGLSHTKPKNNPINNVMAVCVMMALTGVLVFGLSSLRYFGSAPARPMAKKTRLAELFAAWGLWTHGQQAAFRDPLEVLQQLSTLARVLVIHGNYLTREELDYLAGRDNFSVVYCPRTHSNFQHERYPLAEFLQRGIRVALGTDSRASNPDLDLLSEVRYVAQRHPEIAPSSLIEMATTHGAEALGLANSVGSIAPGQRADFCVVPIQPGVRDPFEAVLHS